LFLLRIIEQRRWFDWPAWVVENDVTGDCLSDIRTVENKLSVFAIEDPSDDEATRKVVTAFAAKREEPKRLDYALFDNDDLKAADIGVSESQGDTPDDRVNAIHRDLINVSGKGLIRIAVAIKSGNKLGRLDKPVVERRVAQAIKEKQLDEARVHRDFLARLRQRGLL
jgi:hypothetical protein